MGHDITIERLAHHPECVPLLASWFEREWPGYYGIGGKADACIDLLAYCNLATLPIGVVAFERGILCGAAALKSEPLPELPHLSPWAGAGFVYPDFRRRGIGAKLLAAVEQVARELGFARIYCGTSSSATLLERGAWQLLAHVDHDGELLAVYDKAL